MPNRILKESMTFPARGTWIEISVRGCQWTRPRDVPRKGNVDRNDYIAAAEPDPEGRSPQGERRIGATFPPRPGPFLSTFPLRGTSPHKIRRRSAGLRISIHVPLAGNVIFPAAASHSCEHFYPRSPCGERRASGIDSRAKSTISIHVPLAGNVP